MMILCDVDGQRSQWCAKLMVSEVEPSILLFKNRILNEGNQF
jgi:hypothetical protein